MASPARSARRGTDAAARHPCPWRRRPRSRRLGPGRTSGEHGRHGAGGASGGCPDALYPSPCPGCIRPGGEPHPPPLRWSRLDAQAGPKGVHIGDTSAEMGQLGAAAPSAPGTCAASLRQAKAGAASGAFRCTLPAVSTVVPAQLCRPARETRRGRRSAQKARASISRNVTSARAADVRT